jgi:hypothetical protein
MTSPPVAEHEVEVDHKGHKVHKDNLELDGFYTFVSLVLFVVKNPVSHAYRLGVDALQEPRKGDSLP